ncbi:MAG: hypothetical protein AUJ57_04540 [Zetaproteobacteria bacterium CG1_02_53_45]|nr:MAG: hypothetical protein AUJ57_04540 [Zetaproteobacteria bacterium CG1_02_53_45]
MSRNKRQLNKLLSDIKMHLNTGLFSKAEPLCLKAMEMAPDNVDVLVRYGCLLYSQLKGDKAIPFLEKAIQLEPNNSQVRTYLLACYKEVQDYDHLLQLADLMCNSPLNDSELSLAYSCYLSLCDWESAQKLEQRVLNACIAGRIDSTLLPGILLTSNGRPDISPEMDYQLHRQWGSIFPKATPIMPKPINGHLRIAYVSADFKRHPVAYFMHQIVIAHNRNEFEVFCYGNMSGRDDDLTEQFKHDADHFIDITDMDDKSLRSHMKEHDIHVAVDLGGHTVASRTRAFALRLAPVQISYLGYPNTTGIDAMDFHISDIFAEDCEHGTKYHEKLLLMPRSFLNYGVDWDLDRPANSPCVEKGYVTFGSFNECRKIHPEVIEVWSSILARVENSRMHLKFIGCDNEMIKRNLYKAFAKHGIDSSRITTLSRTTLEEHIRGYGDIDIALDTFPYTGTTTTCEAISQGVPVVTLVGPKHANRVSYTILKNMGFESTIAYNKDEYVDIAVNLASNPHGLGIIRSSLPVLFQHSPLKQADHFVQDLETLYKEACRKKGIDLSGLNSPEISLTMPDHVSITLPNDLKNSTTYIITEQGDWYENEIRFLRKISKPGLHVIDAPAGYGHFSLSLAHAIGNTGKLLACSAGEDKRKLLEKSIADNGFDHVDVKHETCTDTLISAQSWPRIDVFCIHNIAPMNTVTACQDALKHYSPLIMLEGISEGSLDTSLLNFMTQLEYAPFYLVPGLNLLAPLSNNFTPISWDTRIFYCKHDRASELASDGFLVLHQPETVELSDNTDEWLTVFQEDQNAWAQKFITQWQAQTEHLSDWTELRGALHAFAMAHDKAHAPEMRYAFLNASLAVFMDMPDIMDSPARLCSVARICTELGRFHDAVGALNHVKSLIETHGTFSPDEPFLSVSETYDKSDFDISPTDWLLCQTECQIERLSTPTAWQYPSRIINLAKFLREQNFQDRDIQRREDTALRHLNRHHKKTTHAEESEAINPTDSNGLPGNKENRTVMFIDQLTPEVWRSFQEFLAATDTTSCLVTAVYSSENQKRINDYLNALGHYDILNTNKQLVVALQPNNTSKNAFITDMLKLCDQLYLPKKSTKNQLPIIKIARRLTTTITKSNSKATYTPLPLPLLKIMKVTICIPTYNRSELLNRAVQSALQQTYQNFEILISDNASTDDTELLCREWIKSDKRIRYHRNETNLGGAANILQTFERAETELVVMCADDDSLYPQHLEKTVRAFQKHPGIGMAFGQTFIGKSSDSSCSVIPCMYTQDTLIDPQQMLLDSISGNNICWTSATIRKTAILRAQEYARQHWNMSASQCFIGEGDYFLCLLISLCTPVAYTHTPTAFYRVAEDTFSSSLLGGGWSMELRLRTVAFLDDMYKRTFGIDSMESNRIKSMVETFKVNILNVENQLIQEASAKSMAKISEFKVIVDSISAHNLPSFMTEKRADPMQHSTKQSGLEISNKEK